MKQYAIISVWDKTGVCELAQALVEQGYRILSTGGTYKAIEQSFDNDQRKDLVKVSDFTGFPEVLEGRVKTLHPKIHSGILARDDQMDELSLLEIPKISVVVVNLYPFAATVASNVDESTVLENIDIGGHTLIRAAAKNYQNTLVLTDPAYYAVAAQLDSLTTKVRRDFAKKAFAHIAEYDIAISQYFGDHTIRKYYPVQQLKYGCNPHQKYAALCGINTNTVPLKVLNGSIGYINLIDALLGFQLVCEAAHALGYPTAASYKHTSPAGVGIGIELSDLERTVFDVKGRNLSGVATAFARARNCDPLSSFGDFISVSHVIDVSCAQLIKREVSDGIIAPGYTAEALEILRAKKGGKYTIVQLPSEWAVQYRGDGEYREICGMALCQSQNMATTTLQDLTNVPTRLKEIPEECQRDLILANITLKYTQSNSVAYAYEGQVIGIGAGQQNRVDCVKIAGKKAERWCVRFTDVCIKKQYELTGSRSEKNNALYEYIDSIPLDSLDWLHARVPLSLASDAFIPFPDSVEVADQYGVSYILQPGGSLGDTACIEECDLRGIKMAFSGKRMFLH